MGRAMPAAYITKKKLNEIIIAKNDSNTFRQPYLKNQGTGNKWLQIEI